MASWVASLVELAVIVSALALDTVYRQTSPLSAPSQRPRAWSLICSLPLEWPHSIKWAPFVVSVGWVQLSRTLVRWALLRSHIM